MATAKTTRNGKPTQGAQLIDALKKKLKPKLAPDAASVTDGALAKHLGVTAAALNVWRRYKLMTPKQIVSIMGHAEKAAEARLHHGAIRPVVEFFRIDKKVSKGGAKYEIFDASPSHKYQNGLAEELKSYHGVYVFFDSRGHAIYAGKARKQKLWREINLAFNRNRNEVQSVKRVNHPARNQAYKTNDEKARQIFSRAVPLHEMAAYFSAYSVVDEMVDGVEAMLVRSFANDLLNVRMEKFSNGKKKAKA